MKTGLIVFAHGSRLEPANEAVRAVAADVARQGGYDLVETAFLDLTKPDLREAIARLASLGATRVLVVPYFLTAGAHLQRDLPSLVDEIAAKLPDLEILVAESLDGHHGLSQILLDRAKEAIERRDRLGREEKSG